MTQDQIRKLLGGYATDSLTEGERKILFEAALDDQELFNALHDEDALRELLADPVSRDQVRKALDGPSRAGTSRTGFWPRGWVIGTAAIALASAAAVAIVVVRQNMFHPPAPVIQIASSQTPPKQQAAPTEEAPAPAPKSQNEPKREMPRSEVRKKAAETVGSLQQQPLAEPTPAPSTVPALAPAITAPAQAETARDAVAPVNGLAIQSPPAPSRITASFRAATLPPLPDAIRRQFAAGFPANAPLYQGPLVRYSLVRSGPDGDAVRVELSTGIAGYVALYQVNKAGESKRVYPASDAAALVLAGRTVQIPNSPLQIGDPQEKLRLVVVPAAGSAVIGQLGGAVNQQASPALVPLVVDIPLGPN